MIELYSKSYCMISWMMPCELYQEIRFVILDAGHHRWVVLPIITSIWIRSLSCSIFWMKWLVCTCIKKKTSLLFFSFYMITVDTHFDDVGILMNQYDQCRVEHLSALKNSFVPWVIATHYSSTCSYPSYSICKSVIAITPKY